MKAHYRLKLHAGGEDEGPQAMLYATEASRFDGPVARFAIEPTQQVPRMPRGGVVEVEGDVAARLIVAVRCPDGVTIRPVRRVVGPESTPLFAEPGLVHPGVGGSAASDLPTTRDDWTARIDAAVRRARWEAAGGLALLGICVAVAVLAVPTSFRLVVFSGLALGTAVVTLVRARRARRLLGRAKVARSSPGQSMWMRFWWAVGDGIDVLPVASLSGASDDTEVDVVLAAVPKGFDPEGLLEVVVHGDLRPGGAALIRLGDTELWPASAVLQVVAPA